MEAIPITADPDRKEIICLFICHYDIRDGRRVSQENKTTAALAERGCQENE
jgi:hypothetical protein